MFRLWADQGRQTCIGRSWTIYFSEKRHGNGKEEKAHELGKRLFSVRLLYAWATRLKRLRKIISFLLIFWLNRKKAYKKVLTVELNASNL